MAKTEQSDRPYAELCNAVVIQACRDYYHALWQKRHQPHKSKGKDRQDKYGQHINVEYTIRDCESFFHDEISLYSDLNGEWIMEKIKERVNRR